MDQHADTAWAGGHVAQAGGPPARDRGQHLPPGRSNSWVAIRWARRRAVGMPATTARSPERAVPFGRPVDDRPEERDVIHSRLVGRRDTTTVGPAAAVTVGVGDGETPHVRLLVEGGPLAHDPSAGLRMVAMQDEYQRSPAAGAARQVHRKAARPPADRQLTRNCTTAIACHAPVLRHSMEQQFIGSPGGRSSWRGATASGCLSGQPGDRRSRADASPMPVLLPMGFVAELREQGF